ncbi:MAG: hypothetical protein HY721_31380 [Planctomycetes bacterium]|nr:hypothetical protein [Planctomycetota bacterium]
MKKTHDQLDSRWPRCRPALEGLPQAEGEVWQVDVRRFPAWILERGAPERPWSILATSPTTGKVLGQRLAMSPPSSEEVWGVLVKAMIQPLFGEAHRPSAVELRSVGLRDHFAFRLRSIGIEHGLREELDHIDFVIDDMVEATSAEIGFPPLVRVPGVTLEQLAGLHRAAAGFYRSRPWLAVRSDVPVQLESAAFEPRRYYGVVMGQAGLTYGLALYDDLGGLRDLLERPGSDEENARRTSAIALTFSAAHAISPADLHAIERNSWEIAGPNAYLLVTRVRREQEPTLPSKLDLIVLERSLIGLPEFLRSPCGPRLRFELRFPEPLEPLEPLLMSWA